MKAEVGVLLIAFNRPMEFRKSLDAVSCNLPYPKILHLDGPRTKIDILNQQSILNVASLNGISSDDVCQREKNLGCKKGVESALTWGFSRFRKLIIVEDDIVVSKSFATLVKKWLDGSYGNDTEVLCGWNRCGDEDPSLNVYIYHSSLFRCWGWCTTEQLWINYLGSRGNQLGLLFSRLSQLDLKNYLRFKTAYIDSILGNVDTWDYEFANYLCAKRIKILLPSKPLVGNIGNLRATHATSDNVNYGEVGGVEFQLQDGCRFNQSPRKLDQQYVRCLFGEDIAFLKVFLVYLRGVLKLFLARKVS